MEPSAPPQSAPLWTTLFLAGLAVLARAQTYWTPGIFDNRLFEYIGVRWRGGTIPYRDIWDNKPPGIFGVMALVAPSTPAGSTLGLAVLEAAILASAALLLHLLLRRMGVGRAWAAFAATCLLLLNGLDQYAEGGGLTELFVLPPAIASIYLWTRGWPERRYPWIVLSGACVAVGTFFKLPGLAPMLAILAVLGLQAITGAAPVRRCLAATAALLVGFALPWALLTAYFARHGAARDMLHVSFLTPLHYGASNLSSVRQIRLALYTTLRPVVPAMAIGIAALAVATATVLAGRPAGRPWRPTLASMASGHAILILFWAGADLAGAFAGGRFYGHYFTACTASLCASLGLSLDYLLRTASDRRIRLAVMVAVAAPLAVVFANDLLSSRAGRHQRADALYESQYVVADYLRTHREPADTLFVWSYCPIMYRASGLPSAFRYTTGIHLRDSPELGRRVFEEIRQGWERSPPSLVVLDSLGGNGPIEGYFRELQRLVVNGYDPVFAEGGYRVYRRRPY